MRKVALIGAGVSKFGVRKASYRDLIWEAGKACFDSIPGVKPKDLEGLVVALAKPPASAVPRNGIAQAFVPFEIMGRLRSSSFPQVFGARANDVDHVAETVGNETRLGKAA